MYLLPLTGGGVSLEFAEDEFGDVQNRLVAAARDLGLATDLRIEQGVTLHTVKIGGEKLTLSFDDGDPCIIAGTAVGEELVRVAVTGPEGAAVGLAAE